MDKVDEPVEVPETPVEKPKEDFAKKMLRMIFEISKCGIIGETDADVAKRKRISLETYKKQRKIRKQKRKVAKETRRRNRKKS